MQSVWDNGREGLQLLRVYRRLPLAVSRASQRLNLLKSFVRVTSKHAHCLEAFTAQMRQARLERLRRRLPQTPRCPG